MIGASCAVARRQQLPGETFDTAASIRAGRGFAANVPVVFAGGFAAQRLPLKFIRAGAAALFVALGVLALFAGGGRGG